MKDLILKSIKAHEKYAISRINSPKEQMYYQEMMDDIVRFIQALDNYTMALVVLDTSFSKLRKSPLSLNKELQYKRLALQHAIDVVLAISNRFNGKLYA